MKLLILMLMMMRGKTGLRVGDLEVFIFVWSP